MNTFIGLMTGTHEDMYKAMMVLLTHKYHLHVDDETRSVTRTTPSADVMKLLDSAVMKWHAHEVLVLEALKAGAIPNDRYTKWFVGDERYDVGAE